MARWAKPVAIGAVTCALLASFAVLLGRIARGRPAAAPAAPWNLGAMEATLAGIKVKEVDSAHETTVFSYDLDNKTDRDYRLASGPNVVIMSRLRSDGSLVTNEQASLSSTAFVPARNRARIALALTRPFPWPAQRDAAAEEAIRQLVTGEIAPLSAFVLFDQANRYQIELPAASARAPEIVGTAP
jgi:hypothetical protein